MDCPASLDVTLGDLTQELLQHLGGRRFPFSGTFELTERCNLACVHCYINRPAGSQAQAREMTTAQIAAILDQVADAGCLHLVLTGGELFLRPDALDIYRHAKQRGLLVSLFTNGTLLTPRLADLLAEYPPWGIEISLYGHTQETYERVTRVAGSYRRCLRGIDLALDRRLDLSLKAVVLSANCHELPAMKAFAAQLGLKLRYDAAIWPRLDGGQGPLAWRMSVAEVAALDLDDPDRRQEWAEAYNRFGGALVRAESVYGCGAGFHAFHVNCEGKLSMCMMARRPAYDLLQGSFQEGWEMFLGPLVREKRQRDTACRTCTVGVLCTQCAGWSQAVYGDNETPVGFICELGRLRAAEIQRSIG